MDKDLNTEDLSGTFFDAFFNEDPPLQLRSAINTSSTKTPPLFSDIEIIHHGAHTFFEIIQYERLLTPLVAKLSTYSITLTLGLHPGSESQYHTAPFEAANSEWEGYTKTIRKCLQAAQKAEKFDRLQTPYIRPDSSYTISINHKTSPLTATITGEFTLRMIYELYNLGLLPTDSNIAQKLEAAAQQEIRTPLYDHKDEYRDTAEKGGFKREEVHEYNEASIGDSIGVAPERRYTKFLNDIRAGIARGIIDLETLQRTVINMAYMTLDGVLPSPHGSALYLLTTQNAPETSAPEHPAPKAHNTQTHARITGRLKEIMQDLVGPGYRFVIEQGDTIEIGEIGKNRPITFNGVYQLFGQQLRTIANRNFDDPDYIPPWWTGTPAQYQIYDTQIQREIDADITQRRKELTNFEVQMQSLITQTAEQMKREEEASPQMAIFPYHPLLATRDKDTDFSYFGRCFPLSHDFKEQETSSPSATLSGQDDRSQKAPYISRNPHLNEPISPLPRPLQEHLKNQKKPAFPQPQTLVWP